PFNNVARTCVEAMSAVLGGTQSLHTNSFDEAIALPTDFSAKIARDTQIFIQKETQVTRAIDPWAGSCYVEQRTAELVEKAWALIQEVEALGGMAKAIEEGLPKLRIEEAAARKQARIDAGEEKIVGVNVFQVSDNVAFDILEVDNTAVREAQVRRIQELRKTRDEAQAQAALSALREAAAAPDGQAPNLLALAVECARARATLGEISSALEATFGRYAATTKSVAGVYAASMSHNPDFEQARHMADDFAEQEGRRPRIMVAKLGQDGHDRGAKVIATAFADLGFDVDIGPLFQTPAEAARQAAENDVHILGISSLAAGHKTLVPQTVAELEKLGRSDILVVVGGVIPQQDYEYLRQAGAAAIFGPGTVVAKAAQELLRVLMG
ncbi:MAG TPA: methylmalonyl-CoA mutase family protein, partial [Saprospiraceae bacterium]|nr:methylmalonyl-CoA mutase family protein [Saprospiraceae bacterium]